LCNLLCFSAGISSDTSQMLRMPVRPILVSSRRGNV
jgi:hypothetical protein